ncbi:MAG: leucine-rich repeat domain-containing protein [Bacteroidaceae bacterium]|nr:leucine-rich repeat domain-containing protein [Bacteroidaceae bacterium]
MGKKILCLALTLLMMVGCLAGCAEEEIIVHPNGLMYGTFADFQANSIHLHPETDEHLRYALYDNYVEVIECISDAETIVIPDTYKGKPVISIDKEAFKGNTTMKHLTIGNNVLRINNNAFEGCTALLHVTMSSTVNEIGAAAFQGCTALTNIIIPPRVSMLYASTFDGCTSLTKVVIESVDMLDDNTTITDETGRAIEDGTFTNCERLSIIWIPADIITVGNDMLGGTDVKPWVCGGDSTASSQFATNQRLDYLLVDRDDFDAQARLFENVSAVDRTEMGVTMEIGNFLVTLEDVKYYNKLGSLSADENQTILVATFDITQDTQIVQYFDGLNVTCTSTAPNKENTMEEFRKLPLMLSEDVLHMKYPVGNVAPGEHMKGIIVLRVSDRFESVSIQFAGSEEAFII